MVTPKWLGSSSRPIVLIRRLEHRLHALEVDDRNLIDAAAADEGESSVGRDDHIGRVGEGVVGLVEQELVDPAVAPQDADAVGHDPTLENPGHRHQVLGPDQGHQREVAARRHVHPLDQVGLGDHDAVVDDLSGGVDDGHLGT